MKNENPIETEYNCEYTEDVVVCPYCGFDHTEPYEFVDLDEECQTHKCGDCGKEFNITISKTINYTTTCMQGEHDWVKNDWHIEDMETCKRCGEDRFTRFTK